MADPFEVGGTYRNRDGEYEVLELHGPRMVIRYEDGRRLETRVKLQARILKNIKADEKIESRRKSTASGSTTGPCKDRRGRKFDGLQDHDFKQGVTGTHWRARTGFGGLLAQEMSATTPYWFQSWSIYRRARVHIAEPSYYEAKLSWQKLKFLFALNSREAWYGLYLEKNDGTMSDKWDWPRFLTLIERERHLQRSVESAMRDFGLTWSVYTYANPDGLLIGRVKLKKDHLSWTARNDDQEEEIVWSSFAERLRGIDAELYSAVFLTTSIGKQEAIAASVELVKPVTEVYRALLPLYRATVGA